MMHRTASGTILSISEMTDKHLQNTMLMIKRHASHGVKIRNGGGSTADEMWYDEDIVYGDEALNHLGYQHYEAEFLKRKYIREPNPTN